MKTKNFPETALKSPFPVLDPNSFDWEEGDDIFGVIRQLVDGNHPGIFTTVDRQGHPHARWMASLSFDEVPWVYTLTDLESRKIVQIEGNPAVSWMFCNADLSLILNLDGQAKVFTDTATIKRIWGKIRHKEQAYFLRNSQSGLGIAVIATELKHIECCTPRNCMRFSVNMDELKRRG